MMIRKAIMGDIDRIFELAKKLATSFEVNFDDFSKTYLLFLKDANVSLFVAQESDLLTGYCLSFHHPTFYANGTVTWVEELMVDKNYRSKGVGVQLMQETEKEAQSRNSRLVALSTRRAGNFYKKIGYEESAVYFQKIL